MDPPAPPHPLLPPSVTTTLKNHHLDPLDSSPRFHILNNETFQPDHHHHHHNNNNNNNNECLPNVPNAKLRLMCSYGGHIMPRPHDKSLTYVGGETRIVAIERHSSLKDLSSRLSHSLLHGRPFTLKYQLPNEDLDNLITVATDEDLDNMVEEHDRLSRSSSSSLRIRVFLFFTKPDTAVSMCALLDDVKSESWFVDALHNSGILQRGVSDSAAADQSLVNLDDHEDDNGVHDSTNALESQVVVEATPTTVVDGNKELEVKHEVHSIDNDSTYGSSSSASSMANLPPIRVKVDENGSGRIQEQFAQMSFGTNGVMRHNLLDDGYAMPNSVAAPINAIPEVVTTVTSSDVNSAVVVEDDRSDHHVGLVGGCRKPPLPLQLVHPRNSGGYSLPSPDSVASDSSIASANSFSKVVYYHHEQVQPAHVDNNKAPTIANTKIEISDLSPKLQREQVQDSGFTLPHQQLDQNQQLQLQHHQLQQQQQLVYIHHPAATGQVPTMSPYYPPLYAQPPPPQQQQLHHPISQQPFPLYVMPVGPTQHVTPLNAAGVPPIYPTKLATPTMPEVAPNVYKATVSSNPAFVHIPTNQFQQQYVTMPQNIHHQTHSIAIAPSATTNYGNYEYDNGPTQDQVYYTQQQVTTMQVPQYQSMTPAAAAAALSDASKQFPKDNIQYPSRDSQPV